MKMRVLILLTRKKSQLKNIKGDENIVTTKPDKGRGAFILNRADSPKFRQLMLLKIKL